MIGRTLLHYKILERIGAGGMGEVYRARDTKLSRDVAIKVLPPHLAKGSEGRRRFEQEALAIAALKHPNIVTIHSLEEDQGVHFITMELVEGRTLAEDIPENGMSLEGFLEVAVAMTDALRSAHAKGITHRDLKPANVMRDADGRVKILDFGLAKLAEVTPVGDRTVTSGGQTAAGQILGTVAYMSPEQAEGRPVDHQSDLFSLGIVFHEMLTGQNPFKKPAAVSTLAAILKDTPPSVMESGKSLPPVLGAIVERCIAKSPDQRYPAADALHDDLQKLVTETSAPTIKTTGGGPASLRKPAILVPAAIVLLALVAGATWFMRRQARVSWARQEALPEIQRLVDAAPWTGSSLTWEAFELGREVERYIPDDPMLAQLRSRFSTDLTVRTEPGGALVYAQHYSAPEDDWELLGETPIEAKRFGSGVLRLRIEKEGYEPQEDLIWNLGVFAQPGEGRAHVLAPAGSVPEGMVWISGKAPSISIGSAYTGLHMPGLEHLPPEDPGDFYFDRFEVSNSAYRRFVDAGGYGDPAYWKEPFVESGNTLSREEAMARFKDKTGRPGPASWEVGGFPDGTADEPVRGISWYEAAAYAEFAGRSLPTIHHWNRVALTWASADIVPLSNLASDSVVPIGTTRAMSRFGAYDLAGNVREWCYNESSRGDRFILGGGWNDPPYGFNDGYAQSPWDRSPTNGLRTMRYAEIGSDAAHLQNVIELPFRDLLAEPRVPRETFELYRKQFDYDLTPLNAVVEETLELESYIREKIVLDAAYGEERMTVYLFLPKQSRPPYQTVIYFPGSGSVHSRSSESLDLRSSVFVPKSGRTLVFPVYKSTYERGDGLESVTPNETTNWKDHVIMWGKDLRRTVDYLETREDLDTERMAYLGASWGAATGAIMMAIEPRLDTGVVVVAGMHFQRALPEVSEGAYLPYITIPVLMLNGRYDFFFPYETSQVPYFELLGTPPEHKRLVVHETGHSFPRTDFARETLAWLDKYLGPVE